MPAPHRVMVRLSDELYAQLQARGSQGIPLAVLVRDAIAAYLAEQPQQPLQQLKQPQQPQSSQGPPYDPTKFVLGRLCPRGQAYGSTGQSLLRLPSRNCPACVNAHKRAQRARTRPQE